MNNIFIIAFPLISVCFAFNETEFVIRYCIELKSQISCTGFSFNDNDWKDFSERQFVISNATDVQLRGWLLYLNEYLFEKFPNAKTFKVEDYKFYNYNYKLEKPYERSQSDWKYESKIENLILGENHITSIFNSTSFHTLAQLKNLEIEFATRYYLEIDDILLEKNIKLENVKISGSNIRAVSESAFKNQKNLQNLNLSNNKIQSLEANTLISQKKLTALNLNQNSIQYLNVGSFWPRSLVNLNLSLNNIHTVTKNHFKNLPNLKNLDLKKNFINALSPNAFDGNKNLQNLDLSNNAIKNIVIGNLTELLSLNISGNRIESWPNKLMNNGKTMKFLSLSSNVMFDPVPSTFFEGMTSLEYLELSNMHFAFNMPKFHVGAFAPLKKLKELHLESNNINTGDIERRHLSSLTDLERFYLTSNRNLTFEDDFFDDLVSLKNLEYDNN